MWYCKVFVGGIFFDVKVNLFRIWVFVKVDWYFLILLIVEIGLLFLCGVFVVCMVLVDVIFIFIC